MNAIYACFVVLSILILLNVECGNLFSFEPKPESGLLQIGSGNEVVER